MNYHQWSFGTTFLKAVLKLQIEVPERNSSRCSKISHIFFSIKSASNFLRFDALISSYVSLRIHIGILTLPPSMYICNKTEIDVTLLINAMLLHFTVTNYSAAARVNDKLDGLLCINPNNSTSTISEQHSVRSSSSKLIGVRSNFNYSKATKCAIIFPSNGSGACCTVMHFNHHNSRRKCAFVVG